MECDARVVGESYWQIAAALPRALEWSSACLLQWQAARPGRGRVRMGWVPCRKRSSHVGLLWRRSQVVDPVRPGGRLGGRRRVGYP